TSIASNGSSRRWKSDNRFRAHADHSGSRSNALPLPRESLLLVARRRQASTTLLSLFLPDFACVSEQPPLGFRATRRVVLGLFSSDESYKRYCQHGRSARRISDCRE